MNLTQLQQEIHQMAVQKGWWETERNVGEMLALIHSEISEALEEWRTGNPIGETYYSEGGKPEGFGVELADAVIRILDVCERYKIDLAHTIVEKMAYNAKRAYRHGGKLA